MQFSFDKVTPRMRVLKDLSLEYQKGLSTELADRILRRVDLLILRTIKKQLGAHPELLKVDAEDLYQSAVAGALRGASTVKHKDKISAIPARFISYIRLEIYNHHLKLIGPVYDAEFMDGEEERWKYRHQLPAHLWVMIEVDTDMVKRKLRQAVKDNKLTEKEVSLFFDVYVYQHKLLVISERHHINKTSVIKSVSKVLYKIRDLFVDANDIYSDV